MVTVPVTARVDVQNPRRSVGVPGKPLGQPPIQEGVARYSSSDENHLKVPSSGNLIRIPPGTRPESVPVAFLPSSFPSGPTSTWWCKEPDTGSTGATGQFNGRPVQITGMSTSSEPECGLHGLELFPKPPGE